MSLHQDPLLVYNRSETIAVLGIPDARLVYNRSANCYPGYSTTEVPIAILGIPDARLVYNRSANYYPGYSRRTNETMINVLSATVVRPQLETNSWESS